MADATGAAQIGYELQFRRNEMPLGMHELPFFAIKRRQMHRMACDLHQ
jgi:hypothetical protein